MDKRLADKQWRRSHLYKIANRSNENVVFKPNRAQQHFEANKHTRNIILKSRRLGFTTNGSIDSLDDTLFTRNNRALITAHETKEATKVFDTNIGHAWRNFPKELKPLWKVDANNSNTLKFDFGDGTVSSIEVSSSGRSGGFNRVHATELGKMAIKYPIKARELIAGTIPTVPIKGRVDIESTAEGEIGMFADMFWEAWERKREPLLTEYKAFFYNWQWDDEEINNIPRVIPFEEMDSGDKFKEYALKHNLTDKEITYYYLKWLSLNKDWSILRQEYPTTPEEAFQSSGEKLFNRENLERMIVREPIRIEGDWEIFAEFNPSHRYAMAVDVSEGVALDASAACIIDFDNRDSAGHLIPEVVATYLNNKIAPDQLAYVISAMGSRYSALIAVERNNHGHATLAVLKTIYPQDKIYREIRATGIADEFTEKLGYHTNGATKPKMLYDLNTAINIPTINIPSKRLLRQLFTYDKKDVVKLSYTEEDVYHWDLLIALAIAWQMKAYATSDDEEIQAARERARRSINRVTIAR